MIHLLTLTIATAFSQPAPESLFPPDGLHNHSSSIVQLTNGDLLVAWYRGSGESDADDAQILGSRKSIGGAWGEPFALADTPGFPDLNPVLFVDPQKRLWLFYVTYLDNSTKGVLVQYRVATDHGASGAPVWQRSEVLPIRPDSFPETYGPLLKQIEIERADDLKTSEGLQRAFAQQNEQVQSKLGTRLGWMTRVQPIMLNDTRMVLGLYHDVFACSLAAITNDAGATWKFSAPIQSVYLGGIQPAFAHRKDGTLLALMRDNGKLKQVRRSESKDGGMTWTPAVPTDMPNPGSSVNVLTLKSGSWLLLCNDAKDNRRRLTAYLSDDEGRSWPIRRVIDELKEERAEVHYPSAIQTADGAIHMSYTYTQPPPSADKRNETIKYIAVTENWIRDGMRGDVLAFPGAEGYGRFSLGGRGGDVYHVTNLDDGGPGSLRDGIITQNGPRTIVFDVGGTISLKKPIEIKEKSRITIAGQTAPGGGITLRDNGLQIKNSSHLVIRYLRLRLGDKNNQGGDQDVITANYCDNIILDHLSLSWGIDGNHDTRGCKNYTLQWSILGEALNRSVHSEGNHAMCASFRAPLSNVSMHHNLFTTSRDRHPTIGGAVQEYQWLIDFRNNVIYNWTGAANVCDNAVILTNNYFKPGPESKIAQLPIALKSEELMLASGWMSGNIFDGRDDLTADNYAALDLTRWIRPDTNYKFGGTIDDWKMRVLPELDNNAPVTQTAKEAYDRVLAESGASKSRDAADDRMVSNVKEGKGNLIDSPDQVGGWPELKGGPAPVDTDQDGMPDDWETAHNLDPKDPEDRNDDADRNGYTNLEERLNGQCR
jgi:predicted neuraminidase/pectate lyase